MSTAVFVTSIVHEMTTYFGENLHSFTRSIFHINTWMGRCISIYTVLHKLYKKWEVIYFTLPKFCKTISTNIALYLFFFFFLFYSFSSSSSSSSSSFLLRLLLRWYCSPMWTFASLTFWSRNFTFKF